MRTATIKRVTNETQIELSFTIDGEGKAELETGVPFLTHMLDLFTKHGHFNLFVHAKGIRTLTIIIRQKILAFV
ncbi:Imidazoleglycerol-phosphate dehydratase [Anoxybacillus sp. BCO1]|nr:Imidazoleglycerol-phosphate dehydratase [Anoxybacillus sp. BCO1]